MSAHTSTSGDLGGDHRLLAAIKYFNLQVFFKFLYLHAKRRLSYKALLGCIRKVPVCVHCNNIFQLGDCHCAKIDIVYRLLINIDTVYDG